MTAVKFESISIKESHEPLVDLSKYDFVLVPMYFRQGLSKDKRIYLRKGVADKLALIQKDLVEYKFKIWDGYRSREVQNNIYQKYWNELKEKHPKWNESKLGSEVSVFVTKPNNPLRIPPHATGGAVDVTLVDKTGNEINMGTPFDYFGKEAAPYYFEENKKNEKVRQNREVLRKRMLANDFRQDGDEWWHYDFGNQIWAAQLRKPFAFYGEVITTPS